MDVVKYGTFDAYEKRLVKLGDGKKRSVFDTRQDFALAHGKATNAHPPMTAPH